MKLLYNLGVLAYSILVHLVSPFNIKAKQWSDGRKGWKQRISEKIKPEDKVFWIHCASLGEFEQGRPVIEEIRKLKPGVKILLSFFSPSGYEIRKNYAFADYICYLPADTRSNARTFIKLVHPETVVFVKYEFWNNYISELKNNNIPLYLISGIFRKSQHFFKWYGTFFRQMLLKFEKLYVQDDNSLKLLNHIGITNVEVAGDTRFDRVMQIAGAAKDIPQLNSFKGEEQLFLAGSSWKPDEEIISEYINRYPGKMKWVFAPHEIDEENIRRIEKLFTVKSLRFSQYDGSKTDARVLIIDNIGMLSSAYRYAHIAAVGGGFGKGIHNVLEPACWGIPVLFGPRHEKFREAIELLNENGGMTFDSYEKFSSLLNNLLEDESFYLKSAKSAGYYVNKNTGATGKILGDLLTKI
jgi:3-deoxy-D-manno-octulosonic-acid transferase